MPQPVELTDEMRDFLAELLFQLISDGYMHPDHTADCGCIYSKIKQLLGEEHTARIVEDARPNSPRLLPGVRLFM